MHGVIIHFTDTSENLKLRRYTLVLEEGGTTTAANNSYTPSGSSGRDPGCTDRRGAGEGKIFLSLSVSERTCTTQMSKRWLAPYFHSKD